MNNEFTAQFAHMIKCVRRCLESKDDKPGTFQANYKRTKLCVHAMAGEVDKTLGIVPTDPKTIAVSRAMVIAGERARKNGKSLAEIYQAMAARDFMRLRD